MTNPSKDKGDRAERAVLDYIAPYSPLVRRTKAGAEKDIGDLVGFIDRDGDQWAISVKDRANVLPNRIEAACREAAVMAETIGAPLWCVVWKRAGTADVGRWFCWLPMGDLVTCVYPGHHALLAAFGIDAQQNQRPDDLACITVRSWLALCAPSPVAQSAALDAVVWPVL